MLSTCCLIVWMYCGDISEDTNSLPDFAQTEEPTKGDDAMSTPLHFIHHHPFSSASVGGDMDFYF